MPDKYQRISDDDLMQISGGVEGRVDVKNGQELTVKDVEEDYYLAVRSFPSKDPSNVIGQLHNGDAVEAVGNKGVNGMVPADPNVTNSTWVYVPSLNISGWVNSRYIG